MLLWVIIFNFTFFLLYQVSAISVNENLSQMAIGFFDGTVLIVRGDVTRERYFDIFIQFLSL